MSRPPRLRLLALESRVVPTYTVTTVADSGPGSLRAGVASGDNSITFAVQGTITLTSGEMLITNPTTISGPGEDKLTISGNDASRVFRSTAVVNGPVTISGLTLTHAHAPDSPGGGAVAFVSAINQQRTLDHCILTADTATGLGGAVFGATVITDCTFSGNSAGTRGGAVSAYDYLTCTRSLITGNTAGIGGGLYATNKVTMDSCTVTGNTATTGPGGGVRAGGYFGQSAFVNSTISGNTAAGNGGGIFLQPNPGNNGVPITSCTIAYNSSSAQGGGIWGSTETLNSTVVALNSAPAGPDMSGNGKGSNNLIYDRSGVGSFPNPGGLPEGTDPKLAPLGNYGGPTPTYALLPGSPVANKGSNLSNAAYDQRGPGFARVVVGQADIGACEAQPLTATVAVNGGGVQRSMVTSLTVTFNQPVAYPSGLAAAFQLLRTGPGGPTGAVHLNAVQAGSVATLTFAQGGAVPIDPGSSLIDGRYTLTITAAAVQAASGALDGNGDGTPGDDQVIFLHRLFGDADGNATVDVADFAAFRAAFGAYDPAFDYDGGGAVDVLDFAQFRRRFGVMI